VQGHDGCTNLGDGAEQMSEASLRRRLAAGERAFGTMVFELFTPGLIPVLRAAGCEWVVLLEHGLVAPARGLTMRVTSQIMLAVAGMALALGACGRGPGPSPALAPGLANPASENCVAKGGELRIETAGDDGQYGVCMFEDNLQCEEWALVRGECPVGGIRVTGYVTPQARYCAIRGGDYVVTREQTATSPEEGTCTLPGAPACDALALYEGRCR
jgi:putative hemolysin